MPGAASLRHGSGRAQHEGSVWWEALKGLKGLSFPVGMSQCWVLQSHRPSRATWHSPGCFTASRAALLPPFLPLLGTTQQKLYPECLF